MTVRLTLVLSGRTLKRHEFDKFEKITIGRSPDCEVPIDNLGISRHHCEILDKGDFDQIRDLESGNGTFVNGSQITSFNLNNGDLISVGKFSLRYESDREEEEEEGSDGGGAQAEGLMTLAMDAASLAKKHREQLSRNRGYLTLDGGKDLILEKSLYMFGRDSDADVQLSGWFCPRVVALLIKDESGFRLVDVSPSANAIVINGIHKRDAWLKDSDKVEIRRRKLTFHRGLPVGR